MYDYKFDNKINSYTIYYDGKELDVKEVIRLLENSCSEEQEQPEYYSKNGLSPIDCFVGGLLSPEETRGFFKGNIIKYIVRCGEKKDNPCIDDLNKAKDYLNKLISMV